MKKSKVFDLIKTLSKSEKRHFKLFAKRHEINGNVQYLELFEALDKQSEFNSEALGKLKFVKNLAAEQYNLYNSIIKSLGVYHQSRTSKLKVYELLKSSEILFHKGLNEQALKTIRIAQKLCLTNELYKQLLVVNELEQEVLLKTLKYEEAVELIQKDHELMAKLGSHNKVLELCTQGYRENLSLGVARSDEQLLVFKGLINELLTVEVPFARTQLYLIAVQMTYHMVAGNHNEVAVLSKEIVTFYEENPHLIEYTPVGYVSSLFIRCSSLLNLENLVDAQRAIQKLKDSLGNKDVANSQLAQSTNRYYYVISAIRRALAESKYTDALELINENAAQIEMSRPFIGLPQLYDLYFHYALIYRECGHSKMALKFVNTILNDLKFKDRSDFAITIRMFNLILHFENKNDFTVEYLSASAKRYLGARDRVFKAEEILIEFLTNYFDKEGQGQGGEFIKESLAQLKVCKEDEQEGKAFRLYDFYGWLESFGQKKRV